MRVFIFVAVGIICAESASQLEPCLLNGPKFFTLCQNWLPEACMNTGTSSGVCADPRSSENHRFVLDGLGVHGPGELVYEFCHGEALHKESLPSATRSSLSYFWPEFIDGSSWAKAWWQWGRCTKEAPPNYFDMALRMHRATETPELHDFLSLWVGQRVETKRLLEAYGGKFIVLMCRDFSTLSQIYTCWPKNDTNSSSERIACPLSMKAAQTCGDTIFIPAIPENKKQSQFATAVWLMQYTILLCTFVESWRSDCRARKSLCAFTKRTAIQVFAMIHAGTGVVSELWAIRVQAGGEVGLTMWPWLSMLELVTNLAISVLMLFWYTLVCSSLGRAKRSRAHMGAFFWIVVVVVWAVLYLRFHIDEMNTAYIKQMELNPIPSLSFSYYMINMVLELLSLYVVFKMLDGLHRRPSIKRVLFLNLVSTIDSVVLVVVHIPPVKQILSSYIKLDWHSWTLGALFFIRYVTVSCLIEPITTCDKNDDDGLESSEIANTLNFGPPLTYEFEHGQALVVCNSQYASGNLNCLDNAIDAQQFGLALAYIGFTVTYEYNLDSASLLRCIENMVNLAQERKSQGIAFAFSGHGQVDSIIGTDGIEVSIPEIQSKCMRLEAAIPVPKLFFFECCRGASEETRRPRRSELRWTVPLPFCTGMTNPSANANHLSCYATARYCLAYEDEGVFAERLCKHIRRMADDGQHYLEDALKMAGAEVATMKLGLCRRQCPTYESSLTRRFPLRKIRRPVPACSSSTGNFLPQTTDSSTTLPTVASTISSTACPTFSNADLSEPLV